MQATSAAADAGEHEIDEVALPLAALMRYLVTETSPDFFKEVERLELSFSQVKALNLLGGRDPMTINGLSDSLGLSLAGVSRAVDQLVRRGLVGRAEDPMDRRSRRVTLTEKGERTMAGLIELRVAGVHRFVAELEPDQHEALARALELVSRHPEIKPIRPPEAGG